VRPGPGVLRGLIAAAAPAFAASWNSQANQRSQDLLAAWWILGGATIYGNAVAVARLPQTIADALFSSSAYPVALRAIARNDQTELRAAYRLALRVQLAVSMPAAVAVLVAGEAAARMIYAHGLCTDADALAIGAVLRWLAPAMVAGSLQSVHAQLMLALGKTPVALRVELMLTVLSLVAGVAFLPGMGLAGITAGHALAMLLIQIPMMRALASAGLRGSDLLAELAWAAVPAAIACVIGFAVKSWVSQSPMIESLVVGATILVITVPCSIWGVLHLRAIRHASGGAQRRIS
jgi:peptidoglycan biosynthesis protein MviN/MurJ (putative lipid II flippase)